MKHPFIVGDKVHHLIYGEVKVTALDKGERSQYCVCVRWKDKHQIQQERWAEPALLSFKPWEKADHTRPPIKVGWWVLQIPGNSTFVCRWVEPQGKLFLDAEAKQASGRVEDFVFIRHLGLKIEA